MKSNHFYLSLQNACPTTSVHPQSPNVTTIVAVRKCLQYNRVTLYTSIKSLNIVDI